MGFALVLKQMLNSRHHGHHHHHGTSMPADRYGLNLN